MKIYLNLKDGEGRPYATTIKPSKERQEAITADGGVLFEVDVEIPGWEWKHGRVTAIAKPLAVE